MASWDLSPTENLDEAIAWLKKRAPVSNKQIAVMEENAKRQAFWMARVQTAARARRIRNSLDVALSNGMSFETWRKTYRNNLRGIPRAHLETTFRNWTQTTYNAARVNYLSHPAVKKRRPYWVFDSVLDADTTPVCVAFNGTVLPAGHPWFLTHTPPLHHNCRSSIRGLTKFQANKIGIRKRSPANKLTKAKAEEMGLEPGPVQKAPGFGDHVKEPWDPGTIGKRPELIPAP